MGRAIIKLMNTTRIETATRQLYRASTALARHQRRGMTTDRRTATGAALVRSARSLGRAVSGVPHWAAVILVAVNTPADAWTVRL